jgi:SPP1 family predicted phage head-tail adaptor
MANVKYTEPIEIQTPTKTQNEFGESEKNAYSRFAIDYATFQNVSSNEAKAGGVPTVVNTVKVTLRWREGIKTDMRIIRLSDNKTYEISSMDDKGIRGGWIVLLCQGK